MEPAGDPKTNVSREAFVAEGDMGEAGIRVWRLVARSLQESSPCRGASGDLRSVDALHPVPPAGASPVVPSDDKATIKP